MKKLATAGHKSLKLDSVHHYLVSVYDTEGFNQFLHSFQIFLPLSQRKQAIFRIKIPILAIFDHLLAKNTSCRVINVRIDKYECVGTQIHYFNGIFDVENHFSAKIELFQAEFCRFRGGRFMKNP